MRLVLLAGLSLLAAWLAPAGLHAQAHDTVWVWNADCHNPTLVDVRLRLDRAVVFRTSIPICRMERQFENGRVRFRFTPHRALVWYGYRSDKDASGHDPGDTTAANTPFDAGLWQAGGETDAIELGFSALASDGDHMNAIHLLWPHRASRTVMAAGLFLETGPAAPKPSSPR
jgi:hypothetical protein